MKKVRGYLYFPEKNFDEVKSVLDNDNFEEIKIAFFNSLERNGNKVDAPGIFINGQVSDNFSSKDVVKFYRQQFGFSDVDNYDVSIEGEGNIKDFMWGELKGNYVGIRILPSYEFDVIGDVAQKISVVIGGSDVLIRNVEDKKICIDVIYSGKFDSAKVEEIIKSFELEIDNSVFFVLE